MDTPLTRRRLLELGAAVPALALLERAHPALARAAVCGPPLVEQTEGPYFKAGAPRRRSLLEPGLAGTRLVLTGRVLSRRCTPLPGARLDFWQADAAGAYDLDGYRLRGYQLTDGKGRYRLTTVVPGLYPGRTEHIHVKLRPRGGRERTTQLYFPGVGENGQDGIFDPRMVLRRLKRGAAGWTATFDFVL